MPRKMYLVSLKLPGNFLATKALTAAIIDNTMTVTISM